MQLLHYFSKSDNKSNHHHWKDISAGLALKYFTWFIGAGSTLSTMTLSVLHLVSTWYIITRHWPHIMTRHWPHRENPTLNQIPLLPLTAKNYRSCGKIWVGKKKWKKDRFLIFRSNCQKLPISVWQLASAWCTLTYHSPHRQKDYFEPHTSLLLHLHAATIMGWLRLVGSLKSQVSFAKEPYKRVHILQKRPTILRSLLIVATPYRLVYDI